MLIISRIARWFQAKSQQVESKPKDGPLPTKQSKPYPKIAVEFPDGYTVKLYKLLCPPCGNHYFINAASPEFAPSYCPYCGVKYGPIPNQQEP